MSKRKERREREALLASVLPTAHDETPVGDAILAASPLLRALLPAPGARRELTQMKKFRFQLLHRWMTENLAPCRAADIGGGKGLLAFLLNQSGWQATVIDPVHQRLPDKYKDLAADRQVKLGDADTVPRLDVPFTPDLAERFDLLVAMHAHGCNIALIDAAAEQGKGFLVLPCCIIDEPLRPPPGVHWLTCVAEHARQKGFELTPFRLNFKGQNIGLYAPPQR